MNTKVKEIKPSDIDWEEYIDELETAIESHEIHAREGCFSFIHTSLAAKLRGEKEKVKEKQYKEVFDSHPHEYWKGWMVFQNDVMKPFNIDWDKYTEHLKASIKNEEEEAGGYVPDDPYDAYNPHESRADSLRAELALIEAKQYKRAFLKHPHGYWTTWLNVRKE